MKELVTFRKYLNEGIINEGVNLNDTLDTPEDLIKYISDWSDGGFTEAEKILDDIVDVEDSHISGETIWHNQGDFTQEEWDDDGIEFEHFKEEFFDVDKPLTKKDVIHHLLANGLSYDYYADEGRLDDEGEDIPDDWRERQDNAYGLMIQKAKDKYGIDVDL
jgi:hypothetical protein